MTEQPIAGLWEALRRACLGHLAVPLISHGIRSVDDVCRRAEELMAAGVPRSDVEALLAALAPEPSSVDEPGRGDHPVCRPSAQRASFTLALQAAQPNNRKRALESLQDDMLSRSTGPAQASRVRTYRALCSAWGVTAFPMSTESVKCVGASLKAGFYRSPQLYFQAAMGHQMRALGWPVEAMVKGLVKEVVRSVKRGLGPAKLKDSFDVWSLQAATISEDDEPFSLDSVEHCTDMAIIGCWWMLRELEMSAAKAHHLYVDGGLANLLLPVHKTETAGSLSVRSLGCACKDSQLRLCPWHAVERHLVWVYNHGSYRSQRHFPLFPDENGQHPSKQRVISAFHSVLSAVGIDLWRTDEHGSPKARFGGHVLRVSGAQFLASAGISLQHIQLLGRWSSLAVQRYVQLAPLAIVPHLPERVLQNSGPLAEDAEVMASKALSSGSQIEPSGAVAGGDMVPAFAGPPDDAMAQRMSVLEEAMVSLRAAMIPPERPYVVRAKSRVVHLAQHDEFNNAPLDWRSKCGWRYGTSNFYRIVQLAAEHHRCKKCFNLAADDEDAASLSDSSSSGVTSSTDSSEETPS